jgi:hypothetical protein
MSGAWRFAHAPAPRYIRERNDSNVPLGRSEHVKRPSVYGVEGGDCDDDVALALALFGPAALPIFFGDPIPRHIATVVRFDRLSAIIDRVPGAPRWTITR